jgi:hypothetical protein
MKDCMRYFLFGWTAAVLFRLFAHTLPWIREVKFFDLRAIIAFTS